MAVRFGTVKLEKNKCVPLCKIYQHPFMKTLKTTLITFLFLSSLMLFGQQYEAFLDKYQYNKHFLNRADPAGERIS